MADWYPGRVIRLNDRFSIIIDRGNRFTGDLVAKLQYRCPCGGNYSVSVPDHFVLQYNDFRLNLEELIRENMGSSTNMWADQLAWILAGIPAEDVIKHFPKTARPS